MAKKPDGKSPLERGRDYDAHSKRLAEALRVRDDFEERDAKRQRDMRGSGGKGYVRKGK